MRGWALRCQLRQYTQSPGLRRELLSEAVSVEGLIRLDVRVTDETGRAVRGLKRSDFKVRDNGQAREIIAFQEPGGVLADIEPLTVILLIDTLGLPPGLVAFERDQATRFLRQNAGRLRGPVTIYSLEDSGFFLIANPSTAGGGALRKKQSIPTAKSMHSFWRPSPMKVLSSRELSPTRHSSTFQLLQG